MFWLRWIFGEGVDIRLGFCFEKFACFKNCNDYASCTNREVLTAKCLIKQYLLNRAWCQLCNLPVGLQEEYTLIYCYLISPLCEISFLSEAHWRCSVLMEAVRRGAAPAVPSIPGAVLPWCGTLLCLGPAVPSSRLRVCACSRAKLCHCLLCLHGSLLAEAVAMEAVSVELYVVGQCPLLLPGISLLLELLGCTRQLPLLPKSPWAERWPRTTVTRFSCRALLVFDKEKWAAPIFRKPSSECGIYSVDTNIVLELKWLMFSWGGTRVMESSRVCCLFLPAAAPPPPLLPSLKNPGIKSPPACEFPAKPLQSALPVPSSTRTQQGLFPAERPFTKESCHTDSWLYNFWR